jgi:hypothetical protein
MQNELGKILAYLKPCETVSGSFEKKNQGYKKVGDEVL